jgi:hypothetical protein
VDFGEHLKIHVKSNFSQAPLIEKICSELRENKAAIIA